MVSFSCSSCKKPLKVKDDLAGKRVKCPLCAQVTLVPAASKPAPVGVSDPGRRSAPPPNVRDDRTLPPPDAAVTGGGKGIPDANWGDTIGAEAGAGVKNRDNTIADKVAPPPNRGGPSPELIDFLSPPQSAGELGRLGAYRVLKVLGAGGMGVVYKAEDPQLKRQVALKAMLPTLGASESARKRFLREAQAAAAIEHDNIVHIYQVGEDRGIPFMAMQFLQGEPLDERLHRLGKLPLAEVLRIGKETAKGLAAAHKRGLIHRDIKPANLWLEGDEGRVKILDFGLARAVDDNTQLTQQGAIIGTPAYMAPEQATGTATDSRCDLFSLGCVLYRLSTGKLPFSGPDTIATLVALTTENPKPPVEVNPEVPRPLSDLIMRLLTKDPKGRPASGEAVVEAIVSIAEDRTMELPGPAGRGKKPRSLQKETSPGQGRSRLPLLAGAAAGILLLVGGGLYFILKGTGGDSNAGADKKSSANEKKEIAGTDKKDKPDTDKKDKPDTDKKDKSLPNDRTNLKAGQPLSLRTLVMQPAPIPGVKSWSFEPKGHRGAVVLAAYSRDGNRLATAGQDGSVRIWGPLGTGLQCILLGHEGQITRLAWSPDGKTIASGSNDKTARLWDAASGKLLRHLKGHDSPVRALAWSPDGKTLATGGRETVRFWEADSGEVVKIIKQRRFPVVRLAWRPDGKTLVAGSAQGHRLMNYHSGEKLSGHMVRGPRAWSPGYKVLAFKTDKNVVEFWDADANQVSRKITLKEQRGQINNLAWSPDGAILATAGGRGVQFWDAHTGKLLRATKESHWRDCNQLRFSPNGKMLVSCGSYEYGCHVWTVATGDLLIFLKARWHTTGAFFGPDNNRVVARNYNTMFGKETISVWEIAGAKWRHIPTIRSESQAIVWAEKGQRLAAATGYQHNSQVRVWDPVSGDLQHTFWITGNNLVPMTWSPDGKMLATSMGDKGVQIWDAGTWLPLRQLTGKAAGGIHNLAWSPDQKTLVTFAKEAWIWDSAQAKALRPLTGKPIGFADALAWSPDSKTLAVVNRNWTGVDLWDMTTGQHRKRLEGHKAKEFAVAWAPNGNLLATGGADKNVRVWKATGELETELKIDDKTVGRISALAWLPDGKTLAALSDDKMLLVMDASADKLLHSTRIGVGTGRFSPDGLYLASTGDPAGIRLWDTQTGQPRGNLVCVLADKPNQFLAISPSGDYRGKPPRLIDKAFVYVVLTDRGQDILSPEEFAKKYPRKNEPDKVRLLGKTGQRAGE